MPFCVRADLHAQRPVRSMFIVARKWFRRKKTKSITFSITFFSFGMSIYHTSIESSQNHDATDIEISFPAVWLDGPYIPGRPPKGQKPRALCLCLVPACQVSFLDA